MSIHLIITYSINKTSYFMIQICGWKYSNNSLCIYLYIYMCVVSICILFLQPIFKSKRLFVFKARFWLTSTPDWCLTQNQIYEPQNKKHLKIKCQQMKKKMKLLGCIFFHIIRSLIYPKIINDWYQVSKKWFTIDIIIFWIHILHVYNVT